MSQPFSASVIFFRRSGLLLVGLLAFPLVAIAGVRAPFYSALHRQWIKRDRRPSWMQQSESAKQFILF